VTTERLNRRGAGVEKQGADRCIQVGDTWDRELLGLAEETWHVAKATYDTTVRSARTRPVFHLLDTPEQVVAQADELRRMAPSVISTAVRDPLLVRRSAEPASVTANGPAGIPSRGEYGAEPVRTIRRLRTFLPGVAASGLLAGSVAVCQRSDHLAASPRPAAT
jgi:hypothetical protein